ncbi:hypothetical protein RF11_00123 [Thelohanellus kitauei]|uniref:CHCH domain-containing protein n=1 Tax=Thelohanellus kitauei TaxID=669202 RepID=A0A0C2N3T5_THEKT|nr:hypothetical protein RF11_00123 [Thelohanellus kitauei]
MKKNLSRDFPYALPTKNAYGIKEGKARNVMRFDPRCFKVKGRQNMCNREFETVLRCWKVNHYNDAPCQQEINAYLNCVKTETDTVKQIEDFKFRQKFGNIYDFSKTRS